MQKRQLTGKKPKSRQKPKRRSQQKPRNPQKVNLHRRVKRKSVCRRRLYRFWQPALPLAGGAFDDYTLTATVTIKDDKITAITNVAGSGAGYVAADALYIKRAAEGTKKAQEW